MTRALLTSSFVLATATLTLLAVEAMPALAQQPPAKPSEAPEASKDRKPAPEQQTLRGLARLAESLEDWPDAEAQLRELLKLVPDDLVVRQRLAKALFWQAQPANAYNVLKEAKQIDRTNAAKNGTKEVLLTPEAIMGQYYDQYEGPNAGNAEQWYRAALQRAPNDLATRLAVGNWALEKGNLAFAKEQAASALKIEAADAKLDPKERKLSGSHVGHTLRGRVALWERNWLEAEKNFQKIVDDSPQDFDARNNLALALAAQDDPAKMQRALEYAEANCRDHKDNPDAFATLGWVNRRRHEYAKAALRLDKEVKAAAENEKLKEAEGPETDSSATP
jgi:predicted Zn-dependent protease